MSRPHKRRLHERGYLRRLDQDEQDALQQRLDRLRDEHNAQVEDDLDWDDEQQRRAARPDIDLAIIDAKTMELLCNRYIASAVVRHLDRLGFGQMHDGGEMCGDACSIDGMSRDEFVNWMDDRWDDDRDDDEPDDPAALEGVPCQ